MADRPTQTTCSSVGAKALLATLALVAFAAPPALAAAPRSQPTVFALSSVGSPGGVLVHGVAGRVVRGAVSVRNLSGRRISVTLQRADIGNASNGNADYVTPRVHGAGRWLHLQATAVRVAPRATRRVAYTIRIPRGSTGASHYAGIVAVNTAELHQARTHTRGHRNGFSFTRIDRQAIPITIRLPGRLFRRLALRSVTLSVLPVGAAVVLGLRASGTDLITSTAVTLRVLRGSRRLFTARTTLGQLFPGAPLAYRTPWKGRPAAGTYRVLGTIRPQAALGPAPVALGAADSFGVLGASTVTSAGVSAVGGDIGVSPGTAVTGFPPGTLTGTQHDGDATAVAAHADLATAYTDAVGRSPAAPITGDLGGVTLTPGVYAAGAALTLAGTLTLDAQGNPAAVFIFQAGSTLGTAAGSQVNLTGGAQACNVFWEVGSSATLGASSLLTGTILASTSITIGADVTIDGRALARDAAVTMDTDRVNAAPCTSVMASTAPAITPFTTQLTGRNQTITTGLGAWSVTDARDSNAGYNVTVAASRPTVDRSTSAAGTGGSLTLTPATATAAAYNPPSTAPVAASPQLLSSIPATIETAPAGTGQGQWEFPADAGAGASLAIMIPGDSATGAYNSTLTFTTAPPAA